MDRNPFYNLGSIMAIEKSKFGNIHQGGEHLPALHWLQRHCEFQPRKDVILFCCVGFDKFCFCHTLKSRGLLNNL